MQQVCEFTKFFNFKFTISFSQPVSLPIFMRTFDLFIKNMNETLKIWRKIIRIKTFWLKEVEKLAFQ